MLMICMEKIVGMLANGNVNLVEIKGFCVVNLCNIGVMGFENSEDL